MKKLLLICALVTGAYLTSPGQTPADIYKMFSNEKNVVALNINGSFASIFNIEDELTSKVEAVMVLALKDNSRPLKDKFDKEVENLKTDGYETLIRVNKNDKAIKVFAKISNDIKVIEELLVAVSGQKSALVVVKGAISRSELMSNSDKLVSTL